MLFSTVVTVYSKVPGQQGDDIGCVTLTPSGRFLVVGRSWRTRVIASHWLCENQRHLPYEIVVDCFHLLLFFPGKLGVFFPTSYHSSHCLA